MKDSYTDWVADCYLYWGYTLTGKHAHWCPEWDFLPVDESCGEFHLGDIDGHANGCRVCGFRGCEVGR